MPHQCIVPYELQKSPQAFIQCHPFSQHFICDAGQLFYSTRQRSGLPNQQRHFLRTYPSAHPDCSHFYDTITVRIQPARLEINHRIIAAARHAGELGYHPYILTDSMQGEAKEEGKRLASLADSPDYERPFALIAGGETVVKVTGKGLGGRNQELALSAARFLEGKEDALLFSLGSDGTDGPTDAAGGMADGKTTERLRALGIQIEKVLRENDAYHALQAVDGLILTGATGTNVNDVAVLLRA